jgi:prophage DNA circulation protein
VLAHRIYQDATRSDELVARNGVAHPAFMPARPLEVLR